MQVYFSSFTDLLPVFNWPNTTMFRILQPVCLLCFVQYLQFCQSVSFSPVSGQQSPSDIPTRPTCSARWPPGVWGRTQPTLAVSRWTRSPRAGCSGTSWGSAGPHRDSCLSGSEWCPHPSAWTNASPTAGSARDPWTACPGRPAPEITRHRHGVNRAEVQPRNNGIKQSNWSQATPERLYRIHAYPNWRT